MVQLWLCEVDSYGDKVQIKLFYYQGYINFADRQKLWSGLIIQIALEIDLICVLKMHLDCTNL